MSSEQSDHKRQWWDYQTESGARPIKDFLLALPDEDRAAILDEMIEESTKKNPEFPSLLEEARQRRALLNALATIRSRSRISQSALAKRIKTSQPAIARLEAGTVDPRLSTLQRYAASVGKRIQWTLVDAQ